MNGKKRERLRQAIDYLNQSLLICTSVYEDEQDALDNCPENLNSSEQYEKMEKVIDFLDDAISSIESAAENINEAITA